MTDISIVTGIRDPRFHMEQYIYYSFLLVRKDRRKPQTHPVTRARAAPVIEEPGPMAAKAPKMPNDDIAKVLTPKMPDRRPATNPLALSENSFFVSLMMMP